MRVLDGVPQFLSQLSAGALNQPLVILHVLFFFHTRLARGTVGVVEWQRYMAGSALKRLMQEYKGFVREFSISKGYREVFLLPL